MCDDATAHPDTAYEEAVNADYLTSLEERLGAHAGVAISRNEVWLKGLPSVAANLEGSIHPLLARVALTAGDELIPRTFYIGPRHHEWNGQECFSWAAPIAKLFFKPASSGDPLAENVFVRRTFAHHVQRIVEVHDEQVKQHNEEPFPRVAPIIPQAPKPTRPRIAKPSQAAAPQVEPVAPTTDAVPRSEPGTDTGSRLEAKPTASAGGPPVSLTRGMRATDLVLHRLARPRSVRLTSVLATLQPDQHHLVSADPDHPLMIQGHPGTGKTIVAAYRAAYLVDTQGPGLERVILIGPTDEYVNHVAGLLSSLVEPGRVAVVSLTGFLAQAARLKQDGGGSLDGVADDVDASSRGLADGAVRIARRKGLLKTGTNAPQANRKTVYEILRGNGLPDEKLSSNGSKIAWMKRLPPYDQAVARRRYLPLLAQCSLSIAPPPHTDQFDHIIVDEAQDVSPIEWNVLDLYSRTSAWTLVGDMNQRRADASYATWEQIADHLTLGTDAGAVTPTTITRGYRSTQAILRFADQLLPRQLRGAQSLQVEGNAPSVTRVASAKPEALGDAVVHRARELVRGHPGGTVAIITVDPVFVVKAIHGRGWRRDERGAHAYTLGSDRLLLHVPESARGLEFDGVVVVEPSDFPRNVGRSGQLYTSLTRANRELAVVHHKPLPDELRHAGRR